MGWHDHTVDKDFADAVNGIMNESIKIGKLKIEDGYIRLQGGASIDVAGFNGYMDNKWKTQKINDVAVLFGSKNLNKQRKEMGEEKFRKEVADPILFDVVKQLKSSGALKNVLK